MVGPEVVEEPGDEKREGPAVRGGASGEGAGPAGSGGSG